MEEILKETNMLIYEPSKGVRSDSEDVPYAMNSTGGRQGRSASESSCDWEKFEKLMAPTHLARRANFKKRASSQDSMSKYRKGLRIKKPIIPSLSLERGRTKFRNSSNSRTRASLSRSLSALNPVKTIPSVDAFNGRWSRRSSVSSNASSVGTVSSRFWGNGYLRDSVALTMDEKKAASIFNATEGAIKAFSRTKIYPPSERPSLLDPRGGRDYYEARRARMRKQPKRRFFASWLSCLRVA